MRLSVAGLAKTDLEVSADDTVRAIKDKLESLTGLAAAEMKLLIKGKAPDDGATVGGLGLSDGAKAMLMRSKLGAKSAAGPLPPTVATDASREWPTVGAHVIYTNSSGESEPAVVRVVHTDDPSSKYFTVTLAASGAEKQTVLDRLRPPPSAAGGGEGVSPEAGPVEAGSGAVVLIVSHGKRQLTVRCGPESTVSELKVLLSRLASAEPATMRLLVKGKEATDQSTVDGLGLGAGGRLMLLFRERHHREQEGAAAVLDCAAQLGDLRLRIESTRNRIGKRMLCGAEALAELGQLDGQVATLALDLRNAVPAAAAEAAQLRSAQLAELEELAGVLREARQAEAQAELMGQLGR